MTVTDEIKSRIDIVDIVSETVKLRRSGKSLSGFCPFHPNSRTPAFVVFPDSGTWRCFGQCNEGGDIFKYIMKREGMDFSQALKLLAERAGVQLTPPSPELDQSRLVNDRLENTLEQAVGFFRNQLLQTSAGKIALDYLYTRGLKDPIIEGFGYGYAPDSWDAMINFFTARGVDTGTLVDCGLVSERENGGYYDRFRNRIMIPIRSVEGKMAGFGARILDPNDMPKFLNSPQTALFDKGRLLFGLDKARKSIRLQDQAVLVEGYLDVTALHQAGFTNVVSPMGTALSEDHLRQLKKYTRRIILALDADAAGEKATLRGLEVARDAMDHNTDFVFDIHGLLRHENRLQADIRVTTLPEGMDPDEVVNRDPEEWKSIIAKASPLVIHVMESLTKSRDINDPKVKNEIAAQMIPLIEDVPNTVERDTYRQRLARLLRVDEDALMGPSKTKTVRRQYSRITNKQITDNDKQAKVRNIIEPSSEMEKHCLALLTRIPELIYRMDRLLQQSELDCLTEKDFSNTEYMEIFQIISKSLTQDELDPSEYILENIPPPQRDALKKLLDSYNPDKINEDDLINDLLRTVIRMRHNKINESLRQLRFLQEEEQELGQQQANIPFQDLVLTYTQNLLKLNHALVVNQQIKQV
jgi:DNA primase